MFTLYGGFSYVWLRLLWCRSYFECVIFVVTLHSLVYLYLFVVFLLCVCSLVVVRGCVSVFVYYTNAVVLSCVSCLLMLLPFCFHVLPLPVLLFQDVTLLPFACLNNAFVYVCVLLLLLFNVAVILFPRPACAHIIFKLSHCFCLHALILLLFMFVCLFCCLLMFLYLCFHVLQLPVFLLQRLPPLKRASILLLTC